MRLLAALVVMFAVLAFIGMKLWDTFGPAVSAALN
jgi:hypothetical protein